MIRFLPHTLLILFLLLACVDPFWPDNSGEESLLVVEALITNDPNNQYVFLSRTSSLDLQQFIPESFAMVMVFDGSGNYIWLEESESGKYYPSEPFAEQGKDYRLFIRLQNGKEYESGFQTLTASSGYDSVYYELETTPTSDPRFYIQGARFYITKTPQQNLVEYYIYQLEETYRYHVDLRLDYIHAGDGLQRVDNPPPSECWKTSLLNGFYLYKSHSESISEEVVVPLHYVTFDSKRFLEKYSLLVQEIKVNKQVFDYFYQVDQQQSSGSLYAIQPYNIKGNIKSVSNPDEIVLGSFVVGGISQKRSFFKKPLGADFNLSECFVDVEGASFYLMRGGTPEEPLYFTQVNGQLGYASGRCFFCSGEGGTSEKPEFWED